MSNEYTTKDRWTSRKFWAAMFWQGVTTYMLYQGKIPVDVYENLTWLFLGGLFLANVAQDYYHTKNKNQINKEG